MAKPKGHNWDKEFSQSCLGRVLQHAESRLSTCSLTVDFLPRRRRARYGDIHDACCRWEPNGPPGTCVDDSYPALQIQIIYSWFGCSTQSIELRAQQKGRSFKDIKPPNILVKDNIIYLADFGLSAGLRRWCKPVHWTIYRNI